MTEIDPSATERITNIATALEEAVLGLAHKQPLDTSKVNAAMEKFGSRQEKADALCSAVKQVNPKQMATDIHVPPLYIIPESGGTDWAALHVYTSLQSNDQKQNIETLYILPLTQEELKKVPGCEMPVTQQASAAHPADASATALNPPEHK